MADGFDVVVVSPHPDDAVLSCGGAICQATRAGRRVLILTAFTGDASGALSQFAGQVLGAMGLGPEAMILRRDEDRRAAARLGAELRQWDYPDALFRQGAEGRGVLYDTLPRLLGPPREEDSALVRALSAGLSELGRCGEIWGPAAIGGHVDHRLVRRAIEQAAPAPTWWFEDFPYVCRWGARRRAMGPRRHWERRVVPLDGAACETKCAAIAEYRSQLTPLFGGEVAMRRKVLAHAHRVRGERFWRRARPGAARSA